MIAEVKSPCSFLPTLVFVVALAARLIALNLAWPNATHPFIGLSASAAIGLSAGRGLTVTQDEISQVLSGGLASRHLKHLYSARAPRLPLWEVEPGLSVILAGLWHVTGMDDLRPLVWFQILLDSALCVALFVAVKPVSDLVAAFTACGWALFPPQIEFACTAGYDAWASFALIGGCAGLVFLATRRLAWRTTVAIAAVMGLVCAVGLWTRSYVLLWPALVSILLALVPRFRSMRRAVVLLAIFLAPVAAGITGMTVVRQALTGNPRPTRTTFWHTFWAGVGQYQNSYNLDGTDASVYAFAQILEPKLVPWFQKYRIVWADPVFNLEHERVLAKEGKTFIREHPGVLFRNFVMRSFRVVVPTIRMADRTVGHSGMPRWLLTGVGLLLVPCYVLGAAWWWRTHKPLSLAAFVSPAVYIIVALGPFYVERRILTVVSFVHMGLLAAVVAGLWQRVSWLVRAEVV